MEIFLEGAVVNSSFFDSVLKNFKIFKKLAHLTVVAASWAVEFQLF
jgi:hypothetical protein